MPRIGDLYIDKVKSEVHMYVKDMGGGEVLILGIGEFNLPYGGSGGHIVFFSGPEHIYYLSRMKTWMRKPTVVEEEMIQKGLEMYPEVKHFIVERLFTI